MSTVTRRSVLDRFWEKADVGRPDECWPWLGSKLPRGYGTFVIDGRPHPRVMVYAHRFAWELANAAEIPVGLHIDHLCRNPSCCNPRHVEPVTPLENVMRGALGPTRKTHCVHGHEYTPQNTIIEIRSGTGRLKRKCRICAVRRERLRRRLTMPAVAAGSQATPTR